MQNQASHTVLAFRGRQKRAREDELIPVSNPATHDQRMRDDSKVENDQDDRELKNEENEEVSR